MPSAEYSFRRACGRLLFGALSAFQRPFASSNGFEYEEFRDAAIFRKKPSGLSPAHSTLLLVAAWQVLSRLNWGGD